TPRLFITSLVVAMLAVPPERGLRAADVRAGRSPDVAVSHPAVVKEYCVTCHNARTSAGGLVLDGLDASNVGANPEVWEKVVRKLRVGAMPPTGARRPDEGTYKGLIAWLETELDRFAAGHPNPGRPILPRLNRAEYQNVIRDLLALDVNIAASLPPDDAGHGFDNMADLLGVSPVLLEAYLSTAAEISALALGDPESGLNVETY